MKFLLFTLIATAGLWTIRSATAQAQDYGPGPIVGQRHVVVPNPTGLQPGYRSPYTGRFYPRVYVPQQYNVYPQYYYYDPYTGIVYYFGFPQYGVRLEF